MKRVDDVGELLEEHGLLEQFVLRESRGVPPVEAGSLLQVVALSE